ncbi:MAG: hypothetical protein RMN51_10620 [Verrucomicrobiota bacterium]|nr:hypothetical protein [Limisphaera sp.]MDW8382540.1 hypothetical protein [Verrucomicrobiota bacterium]
MRSNLMSEIWIAPRGGRRYEFAHLKDPDAEDGRVLVTFRPAHRFLSTWSGQRDV